MNAPATPLAIKASYNTTATSSIERSKTNPRKTFTGLDELADSLKKHGMIVPMLVRPHPKATTGLLYELVAGERRWRAAKIAKLTEVPILVRDLTDKEVLEIQVIENVQRADVHPLEEADGYEVLIEKHGYDVDGIAAKIGKSTSYVYARLKFCALGDYPRAAFLDGRLSASIALLIARIADVTKHERATKDVLGETTFEDLQDEPEEVVADLDDHASPLSDDRRTITIDGPNEYGGKGRIERLPMSFREAQIHLQRRYMLRLSLAKFDTKDAQLLPAAGSCSACEFRTGNQQELFSDVDSADVCTKPSCFESKTKAAWEIKARAAESAGVQVVTADESSKIFTPTAQVRQTSPFVDPNAPVPMDLLPADTKKAPTWGKLLGKKLGSDEAPVVLAQDAAGAAHELVDRKKAIDALRAAGKIDKPLKPASSSSSSSSSSKGRDPYKDQAAKDEQKRQQWTRACRAALIEAVKKVEDLDANAKWWKWILEAIIPTASDDIVGCEHSAEDLIAKKKFGPEALLTLIILNGEARVDPDENSKLTLWRDPSKEEVLIAGLELLGVNYEKHLDRIKESDKAAVKAEKQIDAEKKKKSPAKKKGRGK